METSREKLFSPVFLLVGIGLAAPATPVSARQSVELEPCRESCGITLERAQEYGDDSGPATLEGQMGRAWMDASGRVYVSGWWGTNIWVFDRNGDFLRSVGRPGPGPGELGEVSSMVLVDDGVFSILDDKRGQIVTFDWTGALLGQVRTPDWRPIGYQTVHLGGHHAVHQADLRTTDHVGYPLHLVNLETGKIEQSFGSATGERDHESSLEQLSVTPGPDGTVWMASGKGYEVQLWEPGRMVFSMRRNADWFPGGREDGHGWSKRPRPMVAEMVMDGDSLLWVSLYTEDENWQEASETDDWDDYYDTRIEVVDWRRGRVIASGRADPVFTSWLEPGLIGRLGITPAGLFRFETFRVHLEVAGGPFPSSSEGSW